MIKTLDQITVNGAKKVWNGYIYSFQYQPSFGVAPSYCTIKFISEDGTYSIQNSDLQVLSVHTINVGNNISLQMYPVNYRFEKSSAGRILTVKYIDTSIILDHRIVVLNGRQGNDGSISGPINPNANLTYPNDQFIGSCYIPVGKELITADETFNDVLQVVYSFPQLCVAILNNGLIIDNDSLDLIENSNQLFFASYIGNLRTVLTQWCTDLGLGFYWENNALHFIDLTIPLVLDTSTFDTAVLESESTEVSIEDTVGRVACAFFGQNRQVLGPAPGQNTSINFKCLTMTALQISADDITSIKAAYLGEQLFYAYHFYLNNARGNNILGVLARTDFDFLGAGQARALEPNPSNPSFNQYLFTAQNFSQTDQYWKLYEGIMKSVGKFYYRPMTYGDFKLMKFERNSVVFYKNDVAASSTIVAPLANLLNSGAQTLQDFLQGIIYVAPTPGTVDGAGIPNYDPMNDGSQDTATAYASSTANVTIESYGNLNPYDNEAGYAIYDAGEQNWQYGTSVNQQQMIAYLQSQTTNQYYFNQIDQPQENISAALLADQPNNYAAVNAYYTNAQPTSNILGFYGTKTYVPPGNNFDLTSLLSPEDINPDLLLNVFIESETQLVLPKIEEYFRSETDKTGNTVNCKSNVIKTEMNFRNIDKGDLLALGTLALGTLGAISLPNGVRLVFAAPATPQNLEEAFQLFSQNLTLSKTDPTIVKTYSLPYIDLPNNYQPLIGEGLMGLEISIDDKGINSAYTLGTRLMQIPSLEAIRMNLEFSRGTNQSRFVPYGYFPYII